MQRIVGTLGFPGFEKWDKINYLGLVLTLGPFPPLLWMEVISKIKSKIVSWGGYWLTMVGKLVVIKAVVSTLPIFQSSLLPNPSMPISPNIFGTFSGTVGKVIKISCFWLAGKLLKNLCRRWVAY